MQAKFIPDKDCLGWLGKERISASRWRSEGSAKVKEFMEFVQNMASLESWSIVRGRSR